MGALSVPVPSRRMECYYRPIILAGWAVVLFSAFWFGSRYPQLLSKARHVGDAIPSMAYSHEIFSVAPNARGWVKVLVGAVK